MVRNCYRSCLLWSWTISEFNKCTHRTCSRTSFTHINSNKLLSESLVRQKYLGLIMTFLIQLVGSTGKSRTICFSWRKRHYLLNVTFSEIRHFNSSSPTKVSKQIRSGGQQTRSCDFCLTCEALKLLIKF